MSLLRPTYLKRISCHRDFRPQRNVHDIRSICSRLNDQTHNVIFELRENGSLRIQLNNPSKRNAFDLNMYQSIGQALRMASVSDQVKCLIFQGSEGFYSSGNDLSYLKDISKDKLQSHILKTIDAMDNYLNELIEIKKPVIAAVDGPAIGIGCSSLGLFDAIIASSRAEFWVPFSHIGLIPEGCSSYTFPRIVGSIRANQMLFFSHKLNSTQALDWGFISQLIENPTDFAKALDNFEHNITTTLNNESIIEGKRLVRNDEIRAKLRKANEIEGERLKEFWKKPAYQNYLKKFYKSKD